MRARLLAIFALSMALALPAHAERIRQFDVHLVLRTDGTLEVDERILWDFEGARKHGIYREIPLAADRPGAADQTISVTVRGVTDARGASVPVSTTYAGDYAHIRIGDPDATVTGLQEYHVRYDVARAVRFFDRHDELYWNATGNDWGVPIDDAEVHLTVPPIGAATLRLACYTGPKGARDAACDVAGTGSAANVVTHGPLGAREGLTLVAGMPRDTIAQPTAAQHVEWFLDDWHAAWALLPVGTLVGMWALWRSVGRDPKVGDAIAVRYEPPPDLTPAEVGTLFDERADIDDVTSTIIHLAIRGWLRIEEVDSARLLFFSTKDYRLVRLPDPAGQTLQSYEAKLLAGLFEGGATDVLVSALREQFYTHLPPIQKALYAVLSRERGLFSANPERVRDLHFVAGIVFVAGGLAVAGPYGPLPCATVLLSGLIIALWSRAMPRRTRKGREAYEHIVGLREFIARVEADRLERLGGRTAGTFERILPYAIVLGVADRWAEAFAGIYTAPPSWYAGTSSNVHFETSDLVRCVGRSLDTMGRAFAARPSSDSDSSGFSSSGSSGGGDGGGGGGSW